MTLSHRCVFCGQEYRRVEALAAHLVGTHKTSVTGDHFEFRVRNTHVGPMVRCLCGESFSCNRESTPLFGAGLGPEMVERNSFTAHLKREGGLARHLGRLRDRKLLDKIAGPGNDGAIRDLGTLP